MRARSTLVQYSEARRMYRVGDWYLEGETLVEVMIAGRWVPGKIVQSAINPAHWHIDVPVDRHGTFCASVQLYGGMRVRPPRERVAAAALER